MKRYEMINAIAESIAGKIIYPVDPYEDLKIADEILTLIEQKGMLPPRGTHYDERGEKYTDNEWERE